MMFTGRGHGHSDSSCSPAQTPIVVEQKVEPKRRRKNNEVLLDYISINVT